MDKINSPNHYIGQHKMEVNDILQNFIGYYQDPYLAHLIANAIEYLLRAPRKNGQEDIAKALINIDMAERYIITRCIDVEYKEKKDIEEENE